MRKRSKTVRLILGLIVVFGSTVLSWILEPFLGDFSLVLSFLGGYIFMYLNPELMSGK